MTQPTYLNKIQRQKLRFKKVNQKRGVQLIYDSFLMALYLRKSNSYLNLQRLFFISGYGSEKYSLGETELPTVEVGLCRGRKYINKHKQQSFTEN